MVDRRVLLAHRVDGVQIVGEPAFRDGRAVDHGNHPVDRHPGADLRPFEGLDQRLGQSEAGGLDDDVVRRLVAVDQRPHGGQEFVGHGAAQAPVGEFDDILLRAVLDAAIPQRIAVDALGAEFVDDDGKPPSVGVAQQMADHRRLSRPEEAGDDGGRDLGGGKAHTVSRGSGRSSGKAGTRATIASRSEGARFDGITTPVRDAA